MDGPLVISTHVSSVWFKKNCTNCSTVLLLWFVQVVFESDVTLPTQQDLIGRYRCQSYISQAVSNWNWELGWFWASWWQYWRTKLLSHQVKHLRDVNQCLWAFFGDGSIIKNAFWGLATFIMDRDYADWRKEMLCMRVSNKHHNMLNSIYLHKTFVLNQVISTNFGLKKSNNFLHENRE